MKIDMKELIIIVSYMDVASGVIIRLVQKLPAPPCSEQNSLFQLYGLTSSLHNLSCLSHLYPIIE